MEDYISQMLLYKYEGCTERLVLHTIVSIIHVWLVNIVTYADSHGIPATNLLTVLAAQKKSTIVLSSFSKNGTKTQTTVTY